MSRWRGVETDELVQERFERVVGLPPVPDGSGPDGSGPVGSPAGPLTNPAGRRALAVFDPGRRGVRALAAVAVLAVAAAGFVAWRARPSAEPLPVRVNASGTAVTTPSSGHLVVAVAGRVQRPGLVRLPAGSRVADAIEAAGGALPGTDLSFVNLARKLVDGELVVIGVTPPPELPAAGGASAHGPVNLNTASAAQLETLPGVGPVMAQHIIDYRTRHGGFTSVAELRQVEGIGDSRYAQLKDLVTV